jgi:predicted RecB family nuclease
MTVVDHVETHHAFWADDETSEISIFLRFLDQLDREGRYSLVHYGSYEIKALRQIRQKVPVAYQSRIDDAIKSSLNLLSIIRPYIYFPTYSNGLKEIAGYLKYSWSDPCLIWRQRWLQGERSYKEKLLRYNQDDCSALRRSRNLLKQ